MDGPYSRAFFIFLGKYSDQDFLKYFLQWSSDEVIAHFLRITLSNVKIQVFSKCHKNFVVFLQYFEFDELGQEWKF